MDLHEYQAKEILKRYGIAIPKFSVIERLDQIDGALKEIGTSDSVIKVQVHAGGRGKAGGVKFAKTHEEAKTLAKQMLGMRVVTKQTGAEGLVSHKLMFNAPSTIKKEYYVGALIDREKKCPVLIVSPEGGMDIEEVAAKTPEKILTVPFGIDGVMKPFALRKICAFMGWQGDVAKQASLCIAGLAKAFIETDASLLEINPLIETKEGAIVALDAKLSIDDNALFRQEAIAKYFDPTQLSQGEVAAKEHDLAYIALDGNIACMVNGAGLAMATLDIISHYGGKPANFLDVGGGANKEKVTEAFKIILGDPKVKAILVNIFGGIMDCSVIASGIIAAAKDIGLSVPLIVRMEGTNVEKGRALLNESKLNIITAKDLGQAAQKAVEAVA